MPKRLLTLAFAAVLLAGACGKIPQGTVTAQGVTFIPEVADANDNSGLGSQVVVDKDGVPYASYLIVPAVLAANAIPIARPIGAPYITVPVSGNTPAQTGAAIGIASLGANNIWTRGAAAQVRDTPPGIVVPYGPATEASLIGATDTNTNGTGIALDGSGGIHVVWTGDDGVYYAEAPSTGGFTVDQIFKYGSTLAVVGPISRPSVAVASDGTPWVAYSVLSDRLNVYVATKDASGKWVTTTVATSDACNGCPPPRTPRIGVTPDGPIVTWFDPSSGAVMSASSKGGAWTSQTVASGVQADGLDLVVGKDGTVYISYYAGGAVTMASSVAGGWTTAKVADAAPPKPSPSPSPAPAPSAASPAPASSGSPSPAASPSPAPPPLPEPTAGNFEPTTGVAVDDKGRVYVTWYDGATDSVLLASGDGTTFTPVSTQDTQGGAYPSVAVAPDGSKIYVTWYAEQDQDLRLGIQGGDASALDVAVPSPTPPPGSAPPTTGPTCGADGKVALNETAQGTAFQDQCLVAPAGKNFSIIFDDKDVASVTGQHNIAIATDSAGTKLIFTGALVTGPAKVTYDVTGKSGPLAVGTYYFHCQVHPTMTGVLAVVKVK